MDFCRQKALVATPVVELDMAVKGRSERSQYLAVVLVILASFGRGFHLKNKAMKQNTIRNSGMDVTPPWMMSLLVD